MAVESDLSSASSNGKESLQSLCAMLCLACSVSEQADLDEAAQLSYQMHKAGGKRADA